MHPFALPLVLATMLAGQACAVDLSGTWRYEKGMDYDGGAKVAAPKSPWLQMVNGSAAVSPTCFVKLRKTRYLYSTPFQALLKDGVDETTLDGYLAKHFAFSLKGGPDYYEADIDTDCATPLGDYLVTDKRLLLPFAGSSFYSYVRSDGGTARPVDPSIPLGGRKLSQLPFSTATFSHLCAGIIPRAGGVPQATDKCAPVFYPYVANEKDADPLAQLIGRHDYNKGGGNHADDYAPPFASKLHPTFMLLPPLKDVLLVRVDDLEGGNDERDAMSGAYLAIRNGKVTDQLNEGCTIDDAYACVDRDGKKRYQLRDNGKFDKL
ncbi:hypothetical protein [uncultured Massilia sp.]|uniref:hypothetical protein n=1 Tax=uncultured Massilia sp. TaxID=169973 RepID=UPI0025E17573|nr:hypothetical protein [uncultured Massilia sp.]